MQHCPQEPHLRLLDLATEHTYVHVGSSKGGIHRPTVTLCPSDESLLHADTCTERHGVYDVPVM